MTIRSRVLEALGTVYDPELDEPITSLRFVTSCEVSADGDVDVRLRLPTPQCAPNFAYLMAADARNAVRRLPEVHDVTVVLEDHYTGDEINAAVGRGEGFAEAFPGETEGELDALRELFQRKALVARESRVCEQLLAGAQRRRRSPPSGWPTSPTTRRHAGASRCAGSWASRPRTTPRRSSGPTGSRSRPPTCAMWLRKASLMRTSLEVNGGICRSLLRIRYDLPDAKEVAA